MKVIVLYFCLSLVILSCSEKKENQNSEAQIEEEISLDSLEQMEDSLTKRPTVEAAETPASNPGPGTGSSEAGLSTDVEGTVEKPANDSIK